MVIFLLIIFTTDAGGKKAVFKDRINALYTLLKLKHYNFIFRTELTLWQEKPAF